jgi:hypothetical protein|tara:strand:+ start:3935 stop:4666 length:732 start_codon:yes stop_codon:yes gene_type:complete
MARSFSTATLTVKLQESIVLGGQNMGSINSFSIAGIKNVVKRYMTATTTEADIIKFATVEAAGQFIAANVRYLRITNLDDTNFCYLVFKNEYSNEFCVKLDKGKSFIYNADSSSGLIDTMLANQVALGFTEATGDVGTGDSFIDNITANGAIIPGLRVSHDSGYMPTGTSVGAVTGAANGVSAATSHTTVTRNATTGAETVSEGTGVDSNGTSTYSAGFGDLTEVTIEADSASCDIEVYIATT